jgi:hypothetical protein
MKFALLSLVAFKHFVGHAEVLFVVFRKAE